MLLKLNSTMSRSWPALASALAALLLFLTLYQGEIIRNPLPAHSSLLGTRPPPGPRPKLAIATFLTGQDGGEHYFNLTKLLAYQMLHDKPTRITNPDVSFVVMCGNKLTEEKRETLRKFGATVIPVDDVPLPEWMAPASGAWSEQFTKLRIFQQTQFDRILYMDSDFLLMHPMDGIFEESIVRVLAPVLRGEGRSANIATDEGSFPPRWVFAARSEMDFVGSYNHPVPPLSYHYFNAGFFVTAPDNAMFDHLMTVMQIKDRYATAMMEQDLLNYVFRRVGPMPWREIDWKWSSNFVNDQDIAFGIHGLHGKFWIEGPDVARMTWTLKMSEMNEFEAHL